MAVTVYFATNRVIVGDPTDYRHYGDAIVSPTDPNAITYGTAFVDDANLTADTVGAIKSIQDITRGRFSAEATADLSKTGRNLLVFIHGFDNSFENALTRAAFNQQWFAKSGKPSADTTVIAFSWPSLGKLLSLPLPWSDYIHDQTTAGQSGPHLMSFLAELEPILKAARAGGHGHSSWRTAWVTGPSRLASKAGFSMATATCSCSTRHSSPRPTNATTALASPRPVGSLI